jgi:glutathione S-transferase
MSNAPIALTLTRHFNKPPARVFAAFTEKPAIQGWYGPEGHTVPHCDVDARVGGKYRFEFHSPAGSVHVVSGEFREVKASEKLVFTWGWLNGAGRGPETLVTVTFAEKDGGTDLTMVHSNFATIEARDAHTHGWTSSMESLGKMLDGHPQSLTPTLIVMGTERSSYVQSVRFAFAEKGIAYQHQSIAPRTPEILAQNPFGKVPVFRCGELSLYESSAILHYINEVFPGPALMPEAPAARAKAEQWISVINCYAYRAIVQDFILQHIFPRGADGKPDMSVVAAAEPEIKKNLAAIDAAYGASDYLVENQFSLPDILLAPIVRYLGMAPGGAELLAPFVNIQRAHAKIAVRPGFIEAIDATQASQPRQAAE